MLTPTKIIETISIITKTNVSHILSRSRKREHVQPRQLCHYFIQKYLGKENCNASGMSYQEIADIFGQDHSTLNNSMRAINNMVQTDFEMRELVSEIDNELKAATENKIINKIDWDKLRFEFFREYTGNGFFVNTPDNVFEFFKSKLK